MTEIEKRLSIPRSTLSGWFKHIKLSEEQKQKLRDSNKAHLVHARKKAVAWHNAKKEDRLMEAERTAKETFGKIRLSDPAILELVAAILYLGEGSKKNCETSLGSSDPLILRFFITILRNVHSLENDKIRCELYLRADQNPEELKRFWGEILDLPMANFRQVNIDKRTIGTVTYSDYKGVCNLRCGTVAIQRKLMALSRLFCEGVVNGNGEQKCV